MNRTFKIAIWNANRLSKHSQEIKTSILRQNTDILFVSETHFTNKSYFFMPRYTLYYIMQPDGKAHKGIALIIRSNIRHYEIGKYQNKCRLSDWRLEWKYYYLWYSPSKYIIKNVKHIIFFRTLDFKKAIDLLLQEIIMPNIVTKNKNRLINLSSLIYPTLYKIIIDVIITTNY